MTPKTMIGAFSTGPELLKAARRARAAGFEIEDAYTPFPVHGMDEAMGLGESRLPRACLAFATLGLTGALSFQYWVSVFDWPMNIGGKSFNASPALLPVAFELTVLVAGLGTVATFLVARGLWPGRRPRAQGLKATDDRFLLAIRASVGTAEMRRFFEDAGALEIIERGSAS